MFSLSDEMQNLLGGVPKVHSLTRSFAYYSGPLYGLILDASGSDWRADYKKSKSFGDLVSKVYFLEKKSEKSPPINSNAYNQEQIYLFEKQRAEKIREKISDHLKHIDRKGKLQIPLARPQVMFNPYGILSINEKA